MPRRGAQTGSHCPGPAGTTLDALRLLARKVEDAPVLVVATYRDDLERQHPLRMVLGELATRPTVRRLTVEPLSSLAVAELAVAADVDADELYRQTGGNPFFVTEVLAADLARVPGTVRDAVLARAAAMSPRAQSLLDAVAITPPGAELWLLDALAPDEVNAIEECISTGMLHTSRDVLQFRHDLARRAIEASVEPRRTRELHRRAVTGLASPPVGAPDAVRLAHHAEAAGQRTEARRYAVAAAGEAEAVGAYREAAAARRRWQAGRRLDHHVTDGPGARRHPMPLGVLDRPVEMQPASDAPGASQQHFVHLCFEGPDRYASGGGLAVRVTNLSRALSQRGDPVDHYFVGDPALPGVEMRDGVTLHRWCQAISASAPSGVYDAEERKIEDLCIWLPAHLADVVASDRAAGLRTVVLAEDWHTAWPLIAVHDELVRRGLRNNAILAWTANNRFGFHRIDFGRLQSAATVLTISRAMKHLLWQYGVNPLVVPNGIPDDLVDHNGAAARAAVHEAFRGRQLALAKVGRWDPDKRWQMAIDAIARLRDRGEDAVLLARGWNGSADASAHHNELREHADALGLAWRSCTDAGSTTWDLAAALRRDAPSGSGVLEIALPLEGAPLQAFYGGADAVLANSGFEPFGLVGLEAMAAGGLVITGSTGEDYLLPFHNGLALDTDDACEIVRCLDWLRVDPERGPRLRSAGRETAARYRWDGIVERLLLTLGLD